MNQKRPFSIFLLGFVSLLVFTFTFVACKNGTIPEKEDLKTPVEDDYNIKGLTQTYDGNPKTVSITPKAGNSSGARTIKYNGSTTAPRDVGTYTVTFDVAKASGWNAASGLSAGILTINATDQDPVADDFEFHNMTQTAGNVVPVRITPKQGKSDGNITIYYDGSTELPTAIDTYKVTFDVAKATGFNAASELAAGILTINATDQTPVAGDFDFGNLTQMAGSVTAVTITPKLGKSDGDITIFYNGSQPVPQTAGDYAVTFNVAKATGFNAANGLVAGTLTVEQPKPTLVEYKIYSDGTLTSGFTAEDLTGGTLQTASTEGGGHSGTKAIKLPDGVDWGRTITIRADNASTVNWATVDALSFWIKGNNVHVSAFGLLDDAGQAQDSLNIEYKGEDGNGITLSNNWERILVPLPRDSAKGQPVSRKEVFKIFLTSDQNSKAVYIDDIELISASKISSIVIPQQTSVSAGSHSIASLIGNYKMEYTIEGKKVSLFSDTIKFENWFDISYGGTAQKNGNNVTTTAGNNVTLTVIFNGITSNTLNITVPGGGGGDPVNPGNPADNLPYDSTIPQRPGSGIDKKMYFQFNNRTNGAYADNQIYITILGKDLNDPQRQWKYVNSSGNFANVKGTNLDGDPFPAGPKHTTAMAFRMSDGANSSAGTKYVYMPNIESGRMFISYGAPLSIGWVYGADNLLGFAGPDVNNTGDPNYNIHFEFLEFTIEPTPGELAAGIENRYHGNTTRVDFFDFPIVTTLHSTRGAYTVGEIGTRDSLRNAWQNEVPNDFKGLRETMRILAPAKRNFNEGQPQGHYFDGYVDELWSMWRNAGNNNVVFNCGDAGIIRGTMGADNVLRMVRDGHVGDANWGDIIIRKPTTQDVFEGKGNFARGEGSVTGSLAVQAQLCAAINRGVAHESVWNNESRFYKTGKPANHYAEFWHNHSINRHAYGFCYDDVFDWATLLVGENPIALVMDLKWN